MTIPAIIWIDKWGRRPMMIAGFALMWYVWLIKRSMRIYRLTTILSMKASGYSLWAAFKADSGIGAISTVQCKRVPND